MLGPDHGAPFRRRTLALVSAAALTGCVDTVEYEGKHVRIIADADLPICGGTVAYMDDFYARVATIFGAPLSAEPEIEYRYMHLEDLRASGVCGGTAAGCADHTGHIYMSFPTSGHELVHIAAANAFGLPDTLFAEGLAEVFSADELPFEERVRVDDTPVSAVLREPGLKLLAEHYPLAGAFMRYLIDRFGLARVLELYRASNHAERVERTEARFAAILGAPLAEVAADFDREGRHCPYPAFRLKQQECSAPALDWDGERLAESFTIACEDPDVVGPIGSASARIWRTLRVEEAGLHRLELRGGARATVRLLHCGGCDEYVSATVSPGSPRAVVELSPGRYVLQFSAGHRAPTDVGLVLTRLADAPRRPDPDGDGEPP